MSAASSDQARVEVQLKLPFQLRAMGHFEVRYEDVCPQPREPEFEGQAVSIELAPDDWFFPDHSGVPVRRTRVIVSITAAPPVSSAQVGAFAIRDCLRIVNRIIAAYQCVTGEVSNGGFIQPLGTSDLQLTAEISVDGEDTRDRWPFTSSSNIPLTVDEEQEFRGYLAGEPLPLRRLLYANGRLLLERGQYSSAVIQLATAVEVAMTQYVVAQLHGRGWARRKIAEYEGMTLGQKARLAAPRDDSIETYFSALSGFVPLLNLLRTRLVDLRNEVAHRGHLASREEALDGHVIARDFLRAVR